MLLRRTREKVHRPQTRRRRENNEDSLEKMQAMRRNIRKAVEIMEHLVRREQKKLNIAVRSHARAYLPSCARLSLPAAQDSYAHHDEPAMMSLLKAWTVAQYRKGCICTAA